MLFSCLLALICVVLAALLRSRLVFVIAVVCWVQNIVLPWLYTKGWVSESSAHSLLLVKDVNIALYNVNVKGDPEWTVLPELGVSGSGVGREVFTALSAFRLIGTFGDPLTAGMALAAGLLLVAARDRLSAEWLAVGCVLASALFFTFSRSAWVFVAAGFMYLSLVKRRLARLGVF